MLSRRMTLQIIALGVALILLLCVGISLVSALPAEASEDTQTP